jgi:hypothetical protein
MDDEKLQKMTDRQLVTSVNLDIFEFLYKMWHKPGEMDKYDIEYSETGNFVYIYRKGEEGQVLLGTGDQQLPAEREEG